jgi:predicted nucleic acid-binding protein
VAGPLLINDIVYAEISVRFGGINDVDAALRQVNVILAPTPKLSLFLAGKAYQRYSASGGLRTGVLPDFFIGAHAAVAGLTLITRDPRRYRTYFPTIDLIAP